MILQCANEAIVSGGQAQEALPSAEGAADEGSWFIFQNQSGASLRFTFDGSIASATNGLEVTAGDLYEWPNYKVPLMSISVWGAGQGQSFLVARG